MIVAVFKETVKGADYRANDTRIPFVGDNLYDTRRKTDLDDIVRYDSISK